MAKVPLGSLCKLGHRQFFGLEGWGRGGLELFYRSTNLSTANAQNRASIKPIIQDASIYQNNHCSLLGGGGGGIFLGGGEGGALSALLCL